MHNSRSCCFCCWDDCLYLQEPYYRRENRAMPLCISIGIEFYNGIVQSAVSLPQHGFLVQAYISDRSKAEISR